MIGADSEFLRYNAGAL